MSPLKIRKLGTSLGVVEGDVIDVTALSGNRVVLDAHLPHHSAWVFVGVELSNEDHQWLDADLVDDNESPKW